MGQAVDSDEVARLLAAKAYLVVRQADRSERREMRRLAEDAAARLTGIGTPEAKRRAIFYHLVLAELDRERDPVLHRVAAMDLSDEPDQLGEIDPFPFYLKLVEVTTEEMTTAHFGDFKSSPVWSHSSRSQSPLVKSQQNQADFYRVLRALGLSMDSIKRHDRFL
jgi:hypothetical protein